VVFAGIDHPSIPYDYIIFKSNNTFYAVGTKPGYLDFYETTKAKVINAILAKYPTFTGTIYDKEANEVRSYDNGVLITTFPVIKQSPQQPTSYIIFKDGDYICAKNGSTGKIDYRDTDAATVIQNAINAIMSDQVGGKIFVRRGTYELSSPIVIDELGYGYVPIIIEGEGRAYYLKTGLYRGTVFKCATDVDAIKATTKGAQLFLRDLKIELDGGNGIVMGATDVAGLYGGEIRNIEIVNVASGKYGIRLINPSYFTLDNVLVFKSSGTGVLFENDHSSVNFGEGVVTNLNIEALDGIGLHVKGTQHKFNICTFLGTKIIGNEVATGIKLEGTTNGGVAHLKFFGGMLESLDVGIDMYAGSGQLVENCYFYGFRFTNIVSYGIKAGNNSIHNIFVGCKMINPSDYSAVPIDDAYYNYNIFRDIFVGAGFTDPNFRTESIVSGYKAYFYHTFKKTGAGVPVGTDNAYGSAQKITTKSGIVLWFNLRINVGGTFATEETVTVKVEAVFADGTTRSIEKAYTATASEWLTTDELYTLFLGDNTIRYLNVYAKSDQASTSVTVDVDVFGAC